MVEIPCFSLSELSQKSEPQHSYTCIDKSQIGLEFSVSPHIQIISRDFKERLIRERERDRDFIQISNSSIVHHQPYIDSSHNLERERERENIKNIADDLKYE